ncbi:glycosyltransferase family 2 protein [Paenibacillus sp. FSL H8-0332]|uniref:glycosyltransferase family 2 protein n=1 Tax=Paenibacillus sp. FSL H8-0332 TaxID=2954742 RepID=UPI0030D5DA32
MTKVSVITSTYNKDKYLDITLAGYTLQDNDDFEIVIVDDGSTDDTQKVIRKYSNKLNIVNIHQSNSGIAVARNKALDAANGQYVIVTDDDRIPSPSFISEHKTALDRDEKTVSIGLQYRILSYYTNHFPLEFSEFVDLFEKHPLLSKIDDVVQVFTAEDLMNSFATVIEEWALSVFDPGSLLPIVDRFGEDLIGYNFGWTKAYGGNISFDKSKLTSSIYYDTNFKGYGAEDVDISYQLYLQNYTFRFTRKAINYHQEHPRNPKERQQQFANIQYLLNKYSSLEMYLLNADVKGEASAEAINFTLNLLQKDPFVLLPKINEFVSRKSKIMN